MKKLEFISHNGLAFNVWCDLKKLKIVGFECEKGIDVEKLRSLEAFNFINDLHMRSTINSMIPCQQKKEEKT